MNKALLGFVVLSMLSIASVALRSPFAVRRAGAVRALGAVSKGDNAPTGISLDVIAAEDEKCKLGDAVDFGDVLKGHKRAVLFAVPGAFTPTCSAQHLPGFVKQASALKAKGVDAIYCLSVNDKYVMKSWGDATEGFGKSGIKLVADGNGEFTKALGFEKDATGSRMGLRSKRYALIVENGKITSVNVDEKGLENSSAEKILEQL
jgi:peroxiredoxin